MHVYLSSQKWNPLYILYLHSCLDIVMSFRDKHDCLEREVLQHRHEVTTLQEKLDSVTKVMFTVLFIHDLENEENL